MFLYFTVNLQCRSVNVGFWRFYTPVACKTSVSPSSSSLGMFCKEERLRLSDRNSILMTQINVYITNPVVMVFQI